MIEKIVLDYLKGTLTVPVWMEIPEGETLPDKYVLMEKTGSRSRDHIRSCTLALQSHAKRMVDAASLNEEVQQAMDDLISLNEICR